MKKYLKLFIFIMIIIFSPKVFALEYNVSSTITSPTGSGSTGARYEGTELNGSTGPFVIGTRYNGTLQNIRFNIPVPDAIGECYATNMTYTITMNMATEDWRNRFGTVSVKPYSSYSSNWSNGRVTFVSYKKIYFTFKIPSSDTSCNDFVIVNLPSSAQFTPFTGETNWNLSSVILSDTLSSSSGGGSSGGGSSSSNQDIINNNNSNTNNIINNNNQNTTNIIENNTNNTNEIINNQNENTQEIKDTINNSLSNVCGNILDLTDIGNCKFGNDSPDLLNCTTTIIDTNNDTGTVNFSYTSGQWRGFNTNKYYKVKPNTRYYIGFKSNLNETVFGKINYYNSNKVFISQHTLTFSGASGSNGWVTPNNASYVRFSFESTNSNSNIVFSNIYYSTTNNFCVYGSSTSKLDTTNSAINNVNDSINNDNVDSGVGSDFFNDFQDNSHGLTGIITAPLTAIQSITSSTCQPLTIPIPFTNGNVSLPCMTQIYQNNIPTIYNIWKVVSFGIIAYFICIDIFHIVKGFKDPESDKVEVLDL